MKLRLTLFMLSLLTLFVRLNRGICILFIFDENHVSGSRTTSISPRRDDKEKQPLHNNLEKGPGFGSVLKSEKVDMLLIQRETNIWYTSQIYTIIRVGMSLIYTASKPFPKSVNRGVNREARPICLCSIRVTVLRLQLVHVLLPRCLQGVMALAVIAAHPQDSPEAPALL